MKDIKLEYLEKIKQILTEIEAAELNKITEAGMEIGKTIAEGKIIHIFGSGHSDIIATECFQRAGGLACINKIVDLTGGRAERIENYGVTLVQRYDLRTGEIMIIISNSGRNPAPIEIAYYAKEKGLKVVAITSLKHSQAITSRHSSGKKLYEVADIVIDNHGSLGDACIEIDGINAKVGPTSTVIGSFILNMIMLQAIQTCLELDKDVPIIISQNLDGTDEYNRRLWASYKLRLGEV